MALSKEDIADLAQVFAAALQAQARAPADPDAAERLAKHKAKRADITARTHKTKTHARYRLSEAAYIAGQGKLPAGTLVTVPVKHVPSHTWVPVDAKGNALDALPDEDDLTPEVDDETEVDEDTEPEPDADEEPEPDEEPEAPPARKAAAKPVKGAKPTKGGRASDKDVA